MATKFWRCISYDGHCDLAIQRKEFQPIQAEEINFVCPKCESPLKEFTRSDWWEKLKIPLLVLIALMGVGGAGALIYHL